MSYSARAEGLVNMNTQKDETNSTCIWSSQGNCYSKNDALQKHKSNGLFIQWRH